MAQQRKRGHAPAAGAPAAVRASSYTRLFPAHYKNSGVARARARGTHRSVRAPLARCWFIAVVATRGILYIYVINAAVRVVCGCFLYARKQLGGNRRLTRRGRLYRRRARRRVLLFRQRAPRARFVWRRGITPLASRVSWRAFTISWRAFLLPPSWRIITSA